jgi:hypothetical protein
MLAAWDSLPESRGSSRSGTPAATPSSTSKPTILPPMRAGEPIAHGRPRRCGNAQDSVTAAGLRMERPTAGILAPRLANSLWLLGAATDLTIDGIRGG